MPSTITFVPPSGTTAADLPGSLRARAVMGRQGTVTVESSAPLADVARLADWARERSWDLRDLQVTRPSLEDVYLDLVKDQKR
jgi:ABC-2 type transport system ATP-binding protein